MKPTATPLPLPQQAEAKFCAAELVLRFAQSDSEQATDDARTSA